MDGAQRLQRAPHRHHAGSGGRPRGTAWGCGGAGAGLWRRHGAAKGREPSPTELNNLIESYVRDEILYREGVKLGLERDDIVVKRRVRQKIEMIAEEDASTRGTDGGGPA